MKKTAFISLIFLSIAVLITSFISVGKSEVSEVIVAENVALVVASKPVIESYLKMSEVEPEKYDSMIEPHGAVALAAVKKANIDEITVSLETADPAKFPDKIKELLNTEPKIPESLAHLDEKEESTRGKNRGGGGKGSGGEEGDGGGERGGGEV